MIPPALRASPLVKGGLMGWAFFSPLNKGGYGEAEGGYGEAEGGSMFERTMYIFHEFIGLADS